MQRKSSLLVFRRWVRPIGILSPEGDSGDSTYKAVTMPYCGRRSCTLHVGMSDK